VGVIFLLLAISCSETNKAKDDGKTPTNAGNSTPTPTPEGIPFPKDTIPTLESELKQNIENNFTSCPKVNNEGKEEIHKFAIVIGKNNKPKLHEIVDLNYEPTVDPHIQLVEISQNGFEYLGVITLKPYTGQKNELPTFICSYNRNENKWYECKNFNEDLAKENNIPLKIDVKKQRGQWQYSVDGRKNWSENFPFQKPVFSSTWDDKKSCSVLIKRSSLKDYEVILLGKIEIPKPDPTPKIEFDKTEFCKVGDEGVLVNSPQVFIRSNPDSTVADNIVNKCNQGTKVKIVAITDGVLKAKQVNNIKWYKIEILTKDKCDNQNNLSEAFVYSGYVKPLQ
jgi:hypothetical protein